MVLKHSASSIRAHYAASANQGVTRQELQMMRALSSGALPGRSVVDSRNTDAVGR